MMLLGFELGGCDVVHGLEKSAAVDPVDPFEDRELDFLGVALVQESR